MKKNIIKKIWKTKGSRAWFITANSLTVFFLIISLVITQVPLIANTLSLMTGGERRRLASGDPSQYQRYVSDYSSKTETLNAANDFNEEIAEEGFILLKNENSILPMSENSKITVLGKNSVNLVYGGSGSSNFNASSAATIHSSLKNAGFQVNPVAESFYKSSASGDGRPKSPSIGRLISGFSTGESPISTYSSEMIDSYDDYNDAAFIVFSRIGGEGYDLPITMQTDFNDDEAEIIDGARSKDDHYLQLDKNETELINHAALNFDKIIIVINSSQPMELGFLDDSSHYAYNSKIKGAIWIGSPGNTGINAFGRIVKGSVNPSGRTVDTYARNFKNDPTWGNFGKTLTYEGNRYSVGEDETKYYFVEYKEGIYVGYRYWETRGLTDGESWYNQNVVYSFGFGLSYTEFKWEVTKESVPSEFSKDSSVEITVKVTNIGDKKMWFSYIILRLILQAE